jgi:hypothetical protein
MTGFQRGLQADSRAGCARDERGRAVDYAQSGNKKCDVQVFFRGATGLEPATSGVTGLFHKYDD